jgi:hypothetical protein
MICFLQERNVVPSLQKNLNDISLEKDAAVVAKVINTCFVAFVLSCVRWSIYACLLIMSFAWYAE